jgi:hypothetical protein
MSNKNKISYSINKDNQLVAKLPDKTRDKVLKGRFQINNKNNLIYLANEPGAWLKKHNIPKRIEFEGKWRLNSNYDLVLDLKEKQKGMGRRSLILRGDILDCRQGCLIFKIKSKVSSRITRVSLLSLKGIWGQDRFNRILFEAKKRDEPDVLIFKKAWSLNCNQQIIYEYKKLKAKVKCRLVFKGFWDISFRDRLVYILGTSGKSGFDFRAHLQTPNLYPKQGAIKYRIGIGARRARRERIVILYGTWKFSRKYGLIFEMDYGENKIRRTRFGATVNLSKKDKVIFMLKNRDNHPLGISLTYGRKFLPKKDFEYFLRLKKSGGNVFLGGEGTLHF